MSKILMMNVDELLESEIAQRAQNTMQEMFTVTEKHGSCFLRFTKEEGLIVIDAKFNPKINGVIADA